MKLDYHPTKCKVQIAKGGLYKLIQAFATK